MLTDSSRRANFNVASHQRQLLALIVLTFIALGISYSVTTPIFEAPDEVWHYAYVRELVVHRALPVVDLNQNQPFAQEGTQAPLYYTAGATLVAWMGEVYAEDVPAANIFGRIGEPEFASNDNRNLFLHTPGEAFPYRGSSLPIHLLRIYSVLLGAVTVTLTFLLAREVLPDQPTPALMASAFVAFLPQFLFITSTINNDNLVTPLVTLTLWQLARILRRGGVSSFSVATLGVSVAGAALAKSSALTLIPLAGLVFLWIALPKRDWRGAIKKVVLFGAIVAAIAGWWYIRNWLLYRDPTGLAPILAIIGQRPVPLDFPRWIGAEGWGLLLSAWGIFGWMNILAAPEFYFFFNTLGLIGLAGITYALTTRLGLSARVGLIAAWPIISFLALARYASLLPASQARLLFPALPASAVLLTWGIHSSFQSRFYSWVTALVGSTLAIVAVITPLAFIAPAYAPTLVSESALPANMTRLDWRFENGSEWLGARIDRDQIRAGDSFNATIYQRTPALLSPSAANFLHVVNSADVIIAQRDGLPASGNWGALPEAAIVADTFRVTIPITANVTDTVQIRAGMYDPIRQRRFSPTTRDGNQVSNPAPLATLRVIPQEDRAWDFDFDGRLRLREARIAPGVLARGDWIHVELFWNDAPKGYRVFARMLGSDEQDWGSIDTDLEKEMGFFVRVKTKTPPGVYPLEIGAYPTPDGSRLAIFDRRGQPVGDRLLLGPVRVIAR